MYLILSMIYIFVNSNWYYFENSNWYNLVVVFFSNNILNNCSKCLNCS